MSPVAIAMWSIALKPGQDEPVSFIPQSDLRITNIALGDELADASGRTSVKLTYQTPVKLDDEDEDDEDAPEPLSTTVLGSLTPGKIEQATIDIILEEDEEYLFELVGKNTIYLTGNYIDQVPTDNVPFNSDDEDDMEEMEDAYGLDEVSSDVEVELDDAELDSDSEDAGRFEEIVEEKSASAKTLKRPRESDTVEVEPETLSKSAQKKLNKKLKAEGGKAIASGADTEKTLVDVEEKKSEKKSKKDKKKEKAADGEPEAKKTFPVKTLDGGLKYTEPIVGTGPTAKKGATVGMRYIGRLPDGTIFDKNVSGKAFAFTLGKGEVIKGWDMGIAGMAVGGERILTIPAPLAYGKQRNGKIPPNSTLNFEVKLLSIR